MNREPDWSVMPKGDEAHRQIWITIWRLYWLSQGTPYPENVEEYPNRTDALQDELFNLFSYMTRFQDQAPLFTDVFFGSKDFKTWRELTGRDV